MHLVDAIKIYCHIMQQSGGGLLGRQACEESLTRHNVSKETIAAISNTISNEGQIVGDDGARYALTLIALS